MKRTIVITGSTGGIGAALVQVAAERGYNVIAAARDAVRLSALCDRVPGTRPLVLDLRDPTGLPAPLRALHRLDAVIHCAGIAEVATVEATPYALWLETLTINVAAAAEVTRALLPPLRAAAGHVVFVNAAPGSHAVPRWSAYTASKSALRELADALRLEEAGNGVRVTTIYPGGTATELLREVRTAFGRPFDPEQCVQPETLASLVMTVLDMRGDAYVPDLAVLPAPGR
ncbi:SDR family oxidoreductase [Paractinoplanes atraurantiacus]|uniref:Short-chain dehydrogenase n=1 Tax=Paractinoplanes atraurantiacus TaxID=1036182 RepID=A0A285I889_9ACTN|nr:SDR family oxidoreductase [Actinoplanes atraurantiacus]SNY44164.1 Short-chain dehydrogenase [Actinoplanes atraurantiacus]